MKLSLHAIAGAIAIFKLEAVGDKLSDLVKDHLGAGKDDFRQDVVERDNVKLT